ncbi:DUF1826 domain-containing protein [uncultured Sphingomonas sp.]|uniref:DUF1826 domain-containing protein n=1 Tax=uncultured Sphingomonas sp. TaxID=158754 RepID=UPI0025E603CD|nr:DUF1826 domain-containing protein [uncultured Sphingomonas sp.]
MCVELAPPIDLVLPDHVTSGADAAALAAIDDPAITLAIWQRPSPLDAPDLTDWQTIRFAGPAQAVEAQLAMRLGGAGPDWHDVLARDVGRLAALFATLSGEDRVEVRLERITGNGCWKFHADYVALRLICTYSGQATQWLPLGADADTPPRTLAAGDVGLFKGRALAGDRAIIHRSPPIADSGEGRLLLVIDAEWQDRD